MSRAILRSGQWVLALAFVGAVGCAAHRAMAGDHCVYKGTSFSDGAAACQTGMLYRCKDGDWKNVGSACTDNPPLASARNCQFGGIAYSNGSASCQSGTQYRCEDGTWQSLATFCSVGDAPIKVVPGGRTCMFGDATVSSNSTICKSGTTFLCSDGDWVNLGTMCR